MKKNDVTCFECGAGFQRLELDAMSVLPTNGEYRCPICEEVVERFDGSRIVAYRLAIRPSIRGKRGRADCVTVDPIQKRARAVI